MNSHDLSIPTRDFENFLATKEALAQKTVDQHINSIKNFLEHAGTNEPTDADVMEYRRELINSSLSHSHINNIQKAIEYYFKYQGREEELGEYSRLPRKSTGPDPYTEEEVQRMITAASTLRDKAVVLFLSSSGVRNTATVELIFQDIDLEDRTAHITDAKQHHEYTAVFSEQTAEAIRRLAEARNLSSEDPVFPSRTGNHLTRSGLLQLIQRIGDRAGVDNPTVHRFRATFANRLVRNGADVYQVQELLGHSSLQSTLMYLQMGTEELREQHDQYLDNPVTINFDSAGESGETGDV